jgi:hypothetical protein
MGAVMIRRLADGAPMADALHAVFTVGFVVSLGALLSGFLVPGGRAQELARSELHPEPSRVEG